ncbi:MAG: glycoside hydrolase family 3 C-terminal domain-containing protein [Candidatus Zhuqueibacterota bacterium]
MNQGPDYKNTSLSLERRVDDLISRMTLEEKVSQMKYNAPAIDRLEIPEYNWWSECLHGVARAGIATVFPQSIGLAATWNTDLMLQVATVTSTEARAKYHEFVRNNERGIYQGLTFWSPNVNIFRDPRWGRGQETYGEDPFLTARMGVAFVKGLQGDDPRYLKLVATPKHYAVHSGPEPDRHTFNAVTSEQDLHETYLPAFKATVVEAKAFSVMGAYNRYMGESCCASDKLLQKILRDEWGFDGYVVSDCGAIYDIYARHNIVKTPQEAVALAVKRGCELNCGNEYPHLVEAVQQGLISEKDIDVAVKRLFTARFRLGMFDPDDMVPYARIPYEKNDCPEHSQLALKAAQESIVLLKNDDNILPLRKDIKSIAVIGPNAKEVEVMSGNYNGTPSHPVTALDGIKAKVSSATKVGFAKGCELVYPATVPLRTIPASALKPPKGYESQKGLRGEYFNNRNLEGQPDTIKYDQALDYVWREDPPAPGINKDNYSVRWTGVLIPPVSGEYTIGVTGDDGIRLYIDETLLFEDWTDHAPTTIKKDITLKKGQRYSIKIEYYENAGGATIKLGWIKPNDLKDYYKALDDDFQAAVKLAAQSDVVVFVGGISPRLEGEEMNVDAKGFSGGDRTDINLPDFQERLLQALHQTGQPVVLVLMNGSALAVNWADKNIPAIVEAWYPGQAGGTAIADVLFGDYNPAGRLPVTFYKSVDQLPPFDDYNMANRTYRYFTGSPLYSFGFGLSYTTFHYSELKLSAETIERDEQFTISVDVENSGEIAGDEVVQLYVTDKECSMPTPLKSLKGFQRLYLKPGEKKKVTFTLDAEQLACYDERQGWMVEPGEFEIMVGGNSNTGKKAIITIVK